jgi:hypothetical protein
MPDKQLHRFPPPEDAPVAIHDTDIFEVSAHA